MQFEIRVFWAGDSRAVLIKSSESQTDVPSPSQCADTDTESTSTTTTTSTSTECAATCSSIGGDDVDFVALTVDHRPDNPSERERIESARGVVVNKRVDSKLAVSRAFGDRSLKNDRTLSFRDQRVTSCLERRSVVAAEGDVLFLFCDGLVEYLSNEVLVASLCRHVPLYEDPVYALGFLLDEVLEGGSRDNMSAVLVQFGCFPDGASYGGHGRQRTFLPGPLYLTRNDRKYVAAYLDNAKDFGHRDSPQLRRAAYREDLKLITKYGLKDKAEQKLIVREIEDVIRDIDRRQMLSVQIVVGATVCNRSDTMSCGGTRIGTEQRDTTQLCCV